MNLINRIQKQHTVWPQGWPGAGMSPGRIGRLDKVIGLIPQACCLFKMFFYEQDLVARSDLRQCVLNEVNNLSQWSNTDHYYLVNNLNDQWQVLVWMWNADELTYAIPVTHLVPALAMELGRVGPLPALLLYGEGDDAWACELDTRQALVALVPLSSRIHRQKIDGLIAAAHHHLYATGQPEPGTGEQPPEPLKPRPRHTVLDAGRRSLQFDLSSPWQFYRHLAAGLALLLVFMAVDYGVISLRSAQIENSRTELSRSTADLLEQRGNILDMQQVFTALNNAFVRQQRPAQLIEAMTQTLGQDVVLSQLSYRNNQIELQGVVSNSADLLERLGQLPGVVQARFVGDVTPDGEGRQTFRAELELEDLS